MCCSYHHDINPTQNLYSSSDLPQRQSARSRPRDLQRINQPQRLLLLLAWREVEARVQHVARRAAKQVLTWLGDVSPNAILESDQSEVGIRYRDDVGGEPRGARGCTVVPVRAELLSWASPSGGTS